MYSLNDIHRALGKGDKHSPKRWLRLKRTQEIINEADLSTVKRYIKTNRKSGYQTSTTLAGWRQLTWLISY